MYDDGTARRRRQRRRRRAATAMGIRARPRFFSFPSVAPAGDLDKAGAASCVVFCRRAAGRVRRTRKNAARSVVRAQSGGGVAPLGTPPARRGKRSPDVVDALNRGHRRKNLFREKLTSSLWAGGGRGEGQSVLYVRADLPLLSRPFFLFSTTCPYVATRPLALRSRLHSVTAREGEGGAIRAKPRDYIETRRYKVYPPDGYSPPPPLHPSLLPRRSMMHFASSARAVSEEGRR